MKKIICYGDSNTFGYNPYDASRYDKKTRWCAILQNNLKAQYEVVDEGMCDRTAFMDNPNGFLFSGSQHFPKFILNSNNIDMLILWLGTNDLQFQYDIKAHDIEKGLENLIKLAKTKTENIIIIPPVILNENILKDYKSMKLDLEVEEEINLTEGKQPLNSNWFKNILLFQNDKKLIIIVLIIFFISIISFLVSLNFIKIKNFDIKYISPENDDIIVKNEDNNDIFLNNVTLANRKIKIAFVYSTLYANGIARFISVAANIFVKTGKYEVYIITESSSNKEYKYDKRIHRIIAKNKTVTKDMTKHLNIDFFILQNVSGKGTINFYKSFGKFVIGMFHGLYMSGMFHGKVEGYRNWINFDHLDAFIFIGYDDYFYYKKLGFKNEIFIPNFYTFEPDKIKSSELKTHNIVMLGRAADKIKGVIYAIQAMPLIVI